MGRERVLPEGDGDSRARLGAEEKGTPPGCHPTSPTGPLQFYHRLPWGVVVDEEGTAQLLVRVVHHQVLGGPPFPKVKAVGFPKQRRRQR